MSASELMRYALTLHDLRGLELLGDARDAETPDGLLVHVLLILVLVHDAVKELGTLNST